MNSLFDRYFKDFSSPSTFSSWSIQEEYKHRPGADATGFDSGDYYSVGFPLPGYKLSDIKIEVLRENLTVKASRPRTSLMAKQDFTERYTLPFIANPEKVVATFVDGFLTIRIERPSTEIPKTVTIQSK